MNPKGRPKGESILGVAPLGRLLGVLRWCRHFFDTSNASFTPSIVVTCDCKFHDDCLRGYWLLSPFFRAFPECAQQNICPHACEADFDYFGRVDVASLNKYFYEQLTKTLFIFRCRYFSWCWLSFFWTYVHPRQRKNTESFVDKWLQKHFRFAILFE